MKMEMQVVAPFSGKVRQVMAIRNVQVDAGAPLMQIEAIGGDEPAAFSARVTLGASRAAEDSQGDIHSRFRQNLEDLQQLHVGI